MLSYFRVHDPYRILGLLAIMLLVYLPYLLDLPPITMPELKNTIIGEKVSQGFVPFTQIIDYTPPLTAWFDGLMYLIFGESMLARHIFSFVIIFFQAIFLGLIFIDKKIFPESTFVPSLIFAILYLFSFDTLSLSGELIGSVFLLFALNSLFREIEFREHSLEMVIRIGFFLGIGSLFCFSFIVYLIAAMVILLLYTRSLGVKFGLLLVSFLLPHLVLITGYSIGDGWEPLWQYFYKPNLSFSATNYVTGSAVVLLGVTPLLFLVASLIFLNRESRLTKYQSQVLQAMFFWMIFSFVQVYYAEDFSPQSFITTIPAISFFIAHLFLMIRRRFYAELAFWVFLAGILSVSFYVRYTKLNTVPYANLLVNDSPTEIAGKKVLALNGDFSIYRKNDLATPFLNWSLSKEIFESPEYYEHVITVYDAFEKDLPDIIIDPDHLMDPFLEKIPKLKSNYKKLDGKYERVGN